MTSAIFTRQLTAPTDAEKTRILEILTSALGHDICLRCVTGESDSVMQSLFRMSLEGSLRDGEVWVAGFDNHIEAAALWTEPGKDAIISMHENYQALLPDEMKDWLKFHLIPKYKELYNTAFSAGESTRTQAWHLNLVAVDPQHYRRGLGRALVCTVRDKADRNHQTMTADVPTLHSVYFFQSLGFKYKGVKNFVSRRSGFPLWCMIREPARGAGR